MRIYIAGPFFNKTERANILRAIKILRSRGFDLFVPMEHFIPNGETMSNQDWGKAVFEMDVKAIENCTHLVCLYYGLYSDSGTAFECGVAYKKGIPIINVCCNKKITSLMIVNGAEINLSSINDLKKLNFNNLKDNNFDINNEQK